MARLEIEEIPDMNPTFWIKDDDGTILQEAHWLTDEDSDESMRADGFVPIEERYPSITNRDVFNEPLYCETPAAQQIAGWKNQLPDDLKFGCFEKDFDIDGQHYQYGAWNRDGDWWIAWNTDEEFQQQLASCEQD